MSNNNCRSIAELLSAYLDNQLPAKQRQAVTAHLAQCPACRAELRQLQRLSTALPAWDVPAVDAQLTARFAARLTQERQPSTMRTGWLSPPRRLSWAGLALAAAWAILYYGGWLSHHPATTAALPHRNRPPVLLGMTPQLGGRLLPEPHPALHLGATAGKIAPRHINHGPIAAIRRHTPAVPAVKAPAVPRLIAPDEGAAVVALITEAPHPDDLPATASGVSTDEITAGTPPIAVDPAPAMIACLAETE